MTFPLRQKLDRKQPLLVNLAPARVHLAKLLIHYYDPQKGSISIGGQKLCDMSLEALNSRISYVAQDQYLFNTSLLENIRLGRLNATDEEVVEAAKKAQCMEFLEKLPQGIHSMAGDAGKMLSGGQRQRISLARAILKDAPIVVLDEATAYADPENEEKMEAAIAELVKGKTLVVIAHKLASHYERRSDLCYGSRKTGCNGQTSRADPSPALNIKSCGKRHKTAPSGKYTLQRRGNKCLLCFQEY